MVGFIVTTEIPLGTPQRMIPRRVNWERKACLECGHHQPWAEILGWIRRRWTEPQHSPLCDSWLVRPVVFQVLRGCWWGSSQSPLHSVKSSDSSRHGYWPDGPSHCEGFPFSLRTYSHSYGVIRAPRGQRKTSLLTFWGWTYCPCLTKSQEAVLNSVTVPTVFLNNTEPRPVASSRKRGTAVASSAGRAGSLTVQSDSSPQCHRDSRVFLRHSAYLK